MKNFIQKGNTVTFTAPQDLVSGSGVVVGSVFGIASNDAAKDEDVELQLTGVVEINKNVGEVWKQGDLIYWTQKDKCATKEAAGNLLIGISVKADNNSGSAAVRLNGVFLPIPAK